MKKTHAVAAAALLLAGALYAKQAMDAKEAQLLERLHGLGEDVSELSRNVARFDDDGRKRRKTDLGEYVSELSRNVARFDDDGRKRRRTDQAKARDARGRYAKKINKSRSVARLDDDGRRLRSSTKTEMMKPVRALTDSLHRKIEHVESQMEDLRNMLDENAPGNWKAESHGIYIKQMPFAPGINTSRTPTYFSLTPRGSQG